MAENRESVQGFKAPRAGKWRVTGWKREGSETLGRYFVDPYLWDSEEAAKARVMEYMDAGAGSSGHSELYLKPDGTLCDFDELAAGAFEVVEGPPGDFGLRFNLPGSHGHFIPIVKGPPANAPHGPWGWDGNFDSPTVTPSIYHVGYWHGFFQNGYFKSC